MTKKFVVCVCVCFKYNLMYPEKTVHTHTVWGGGLHSQGFGTYGWFYTGCISIASQSTQQPPLPSEGAGEVRVGVGADYEAVWSDGGDVAESIRLRHTVRVHDSSWIFGSSVLIGPRSWSVLIRKMFIFPADWTPVLVFFRVFPKSC